jgi:DNA-binding transcriptional MerR regulator
MTTEDDFMNQPKGLMTIGTLSRRTGVPVKTLRTYEDLGLIYTAGRSA